MFQWPLYLIGLLLPAALFLASLWESRQRRAILERFAGARLLDRFLPAGLPKRQGLKRGLMTAALTLTVIAGAGPRYGKTLKEIKRQGSDIVICVDVSASMLAEDIAPNRITKAKRELSELIDNLHGDRVGIVSFAGTAFLQCPLTTDLDAATMYLDLLDPASFPVPGTDIGSAIHLAAQTLSTGGHSAVVLLTDGEDFGSETMQAVQEAADKNIRVYCVGFGTTQGELIKIRDADGKVTGFKKDEKGETVVSRLDEGLLSKISQQTGGRYFPASNGDIEVEELAHEIQGLKKENRGMEELSQLEYRFQIPLFLAFLCALIELLIPESKMNPFARIGQLVRREKKTVATLLLLLTAATAHAGFRDDINAGNKNYNKAQWPEALGAYRNAEAENPGSGIASYNIGNTLYRTGQFEDALTELSRSTTTLTTPELKAAALYNRGNAYARMGKNLEAIEEYKKALLLNPRDEDAKFNIEFLKKSPPPQQKQSQNNSGKGGQNRNNPDKKSGGGNDKNNQGGESKNPEALSKEDAQRLLDAMKEQEKQQFQAQPSSKPIPERSPKGKDW